MTENAASWCRHCGAATRMTREHVPPRSAGNSNPIRRLVDPFAQDAVVMEVDAWNDGHAVTTLCGPCNVRASRWGYVAEYRRWHETFVVVARRYAAEHGVDPLLGPDPFRIELPYDVHPARFVRQVIGMFIAVQSGPAVVSDHPQLMELIDSDVNDAAKRRADGLSIAPLRLKMVVDNGPYAYLAAPALAITIPTSDGTSAVWTPPGSRSSHFDLMLMRFAPFAFFLTHGDSHPGLDISHWTTWNVDQRMRRSQRLLEVPTVLSMKTITAGMLHPQPPKLRNTESDADRSKYSSLRSSDGQASIVIGDDEQ